jgi:site-specific DNA recombinase
MAMLAEAKSRIRCAIYTRKSSEEGLEQSFNSLDAQREACRAFIGSQKHEGWHALKAFYDDGGFSGATMERPALRRLIEDVKEGKIDAVVVYKVDRLTRSLADFAKIVEIFDTHEVSFVSVTQHFNTTTSMGRLTLNVLLSFAQFEREVTGERIRDKIAASKRKGMWMGGFPPLGYDLKDRKLLVNPSEAEQVREIYRQYLKLGCVSKLKTYLEGKGIRTKERVSQSGHKSGGAVYSRGALYNLLRNRLYLGEIEHRGQGYAGEHEAIVPRKLWDRVRAQLQANDRAHENRSRAAAPSLLAGLIYDERGNRFTPAHAVKNGKRYRYYVSQAAIRNPGSSHQDPIRIPAGEIEGLVYSKLRSFLGSSHEIIAALGLQRGKGADTRDNLAAAGRWSQQLASADIAEIRSFVQSLISRVIVHTASLDLLVQKEVLRATLAGEGRLGNSPKVNHSNGHLRLGIKAVLKRCGGEVRLVLPADSSDQSPAHPRSSLIKTVVRAHDWYQRIIRGELSGSWSIARATGLDERYVRRVLQCAFLAPDIVESILKGRQPAQMSFDRFRQPVSIEWSAQREVLGFPGKLPYRRSIY